MRCFIFYIYIYVQSALQYIAVFFVYMIFYIFNMLPPKLIWKLARPISWVLYIVSTSRKKVVLKNLELCFPQKTSAEKIKIAKDNFYYMTVAALDYYLVFLASKEKLEKIVKIEIDDSIKQEYKNGNFIALVGHMLNLDVCMLTASIEHAAIGVYRQTKHKVFDRELQKARMRFKAKCFSRNSMSLKDVAKMLRNGNSLVYVPDQDFGSIKEILFVPFFSYPDCPTLNTLPRLVKLTNVQVCTIWSYKTKEGYVVRIGPLWSDYPTNDLIKDTRRINSFLEELITKAPAQYLWAHKRFKTRPPEKRDYLY